MGQTIFAVAVMIAGAGLSAAATTAVYTAGANPPLVASMRDPNSGRRYFATLTPEKDVNGRAVVVDLELRSYPGRIGPNLLEPKGRWHGIQPFNFAADHRAANPTTWVYGPAAHHPDQGDKRGTSGDDFKHAR